MRWLNVIYLTLIMWILTFYINSVNSTTPGELGQWKSLNILISKVGECHFLNYDTIRLIASFPLLLSLSLSLSLSLYIYIYIVGIRYPDEPLRRNCSRLVPDSRNNFCHFIYIYIYQHQAILISRICLTLLITISLYGPWLLEDPVDGIKNPHRVEEYRYLLTSPHWFAHLSRTLFMSPSLFLQRSPECLIRLTWIFCKMRC